VQTEKSIYDLKQSPRAWYDKLSHSLLLRNFDKSSADFFIFVKLSDGTTVIVLVYVDNIIITGNNEKEIKILRTI
jgi:Reverse transcriptase (RNA-dependent DNA polymerase)